jgi:DHA2 family multidrug resistance protein
LRHFLPNRADGTGLTNLMRNIGSAIGVSRHPGRLDSDRPFAVFRHTSVFNRALGVNGSSLTMNPQIPFGLANLNGLIEYRAQVRAFMFVISMPAFVVIWLMKRPSFMAGATPKTEVVD